MKHKRAIIVLAILAVVVLLAVFLLPRLLTRNHDLRSALASALQVSAERQKDFFINLPPADARFPGSILATSKFLVLDRSDANNPDIHPGGTFQLSTDDAVAASALGSLSVPALQEAAENKQAITLELKIANGKVLEMDVPQLKHRLLESQAAGDAANKGTDPLVITRAYSGQLTFLLHRRSKESVDLWNRLIRSSSASKTTISVSAQTGQVRANYLLKSAIRLSSPSKLALPVSLRVISVRSPPTFNSALSGLPTCRRSHTRQRVLPYPGYLRRLLPAIIRRCKRCARTGTLPAHP